MQFKEISLSNFVKIFFMITTVHSSETKQKKEITY